MKTRLEIYEAILQYSGAKLKSEWNKSDFDFYERCLKPRGWVYDKENYSCYRDYEGLLLNSGHDVLTPVGECFVDWFYFDTDLGFFIAQLMFK